MTEQCNIVGSLDRNIQQAEDEWEYALTFGQTSNNRKLLSSLLSINDEVDCDLEAIYDRQHINSASGADLDKWGRLVNVSRRSDELSESEYIYGFPFGETLASGESFTVEAGEKYFIQQDTTIDGLLTVNGTVVSTGTFVGTGTITGTGSVSGDQTVFSDDKFRARIKAVFRASTIGTTFDQFVEFCASVLSTDFDNIDFFTSYDANPATVTVRADNSVFNAVGFAAEDVDELLQRGVPAGHAVNVEVDGTFELKADGETDDPDKGLTADGSSTGGTLTADLIA